ncbi:MAG: cytochrome-c peroxidase [Chitinophagaceae bacterium]|nr:cytochrome-c peroxidase [Chitinophagaceae bacterium]
MKIKIIISLLLIVLTGTSFLYDGPPKPTYLKLTIPRGWPKPGNNIFANNPLTEEGFQLGKKLFYDGRLSKDGNIPCASCHQQFAAFSTYDHDFSHGFNNSFTKRNAPPLFNLAWMKELHWDGAINHIEVQPLAPMTAKNEMAETIENVLKKLNTDTSYKRMFKAAFGNASINSQRMLRALAQFTGSIQSYNSKYDKVKRGEATFTMSEEQGYTIFKASCNACHTEPLFTDNKFRNNGLDVNKSLLDSGRMAITGNTADSLKFKVPSLRNLYLTSPYMHDGRMITLQQVLEHYRSGINISQSTLDTLLKKRIAISEREEVDLLAFLYTLTDKDMSTNKRYAEVVTYKIHEGPH